MLDKLEAAAVAGYQPYWVVRGHVLQRLGQRADANLALDRAIGLTEDDAVRRYLLSHRG
jgi:RNA polymerase sigma-70 factor (ECF subfamily)